MKKLLILSILALLAVSCSKEAPVEPKLNPRHMMFVNPELVLDSAYFNVMDTAISNKIINEYDSIKNAGR